MRREGRQHGMVLTYTVLPPHVNPKPMGRILNRVGSPPTAGMFTKVPNKPTNHSRFTGYNNVHDKLKDKVKGSHKAKSTDVAFNHKLATWRVMGDRPVNKVRVYGCSASRILDELANDHDEVYYDDDDDVNEANDDIEEDVNHDGDVVAVVNDEHDDVVDDMGFYDVTLVWDPVTDDEGWSLVGGDL